MRLTRTTRDFQNALMTLLETNSFEHLTVDQICEEAMLHRSSFYRYFDDKYDLLAQTLNTQIGRIADSGESEEDVIKQFVMYIDGHKDLVRHLASSSSHSSLYTEMLQILSKVLLERRESGTKDSIILALKKSDNPEMTAYLFSGSIIGVFFWWQKNNYELPTEDFINFAKQSVLSLSK
ncbi:MAG: TetR/AcrR family transcriptional regulator [Limosilactobacillus sp.]|uniref:TetR/AcrR family transcriptional regulator n=1 Tax=Limosilactobacillus sp. TaxID=2773925 RepID=UPI002707B587|nr:TetR/AcrR family transcriptional regulator [Limosilactobacillus sp.]